MASTDYDLVQYTSRPHEQTAPANLAGISKLFGIEPADVSKARVLELGCAAGGNLIPHAITNPDASYVGIDLSSVQIEQGNKLVNELQITNTSLIAMSIEDIRADLGKFDYIIAHGLFSWVPKSLQETVLKVISNHLSPNGIAYVSFNTLPGWHLANYVRDAMLFQTSTITDLKDKASRARGVLKDMIEATEDQNSTLSQLLRDEARLLENKGDHYLIYDHLNPENHPIHFHEFMELASQQDLQFVADADLNLTFAENFPDQISRKLRNEPDPVRQQQLIDFYSNRRFRKTVLTHKQVSVNPIPDSASLDSLFFYCQLAQHSEFSEQNLAHGAVMQFQTHENTSFNVTDPLLKRLLYLLLEKSGSTMSLEHLIQEIEGLVAEGDRDKVPDLVKSQLINLIKNNIVKVSSLAARYNKKPGDKPEASELAREQAKHAQLLTNMRHQNVSLPEFERFFISYLNGDRTIEQVAFEMESVGFNSLPAHHPAKKMAEHSILELQNLLRSCLEKFRKNALIK